MDKHALPAEFERYLDRLCDWELRKYEETLEEETLPEDLYEEDLPRWEVDDEPEDYFGSGPCWEELLRLEELKELDPDAAIRAENEAREEALMRAKATIKVYRAMGYPPPSDYDCTDDW
jgi:hypothetical protein